MSRRYDSRTTIFSPEGRLYQVCSRDLQLASACVRARAQPRLQHAVFRWQRCAALRYFCTPVGGETMCCAPCRLGLTKRVHVP
eukprot:6198118-Pleurochrysis_carterae.AAC.1